MTVPTAREQLLRRAYEAFNSRDIESALKLMHPDVDWPNVMEGRREHGREAVRQYWTRQFELIDSHVEPQRFREETNGREARVVVEVRQVVRDAAGNLISDQPVEHVYGFRDGLVQRMDVRPSGQARKPSGSSSP